jgi:hypothetical protein
MARVVSRSDAQALAVVQIVCCRRMLDRMSDVVEVVDEGVHSSSGVLQSNLPSSSAM